MLHDRRVDERNPRRRALRVEVEVLMLDAAGFHGQEDEVALFPIPALALHDRVPLTFDHIDDEPTLVSVLPRLRPQFVREDDPLLERRLLVHLMVEVVANTSLPRELDVAITLSDYDGTGFVALHPLFIKAEHPIVDPLRLGLAITATVFRCVLELLESRTAIDAGTSVEVRLDGEEAGGTLGIVVDVLYDDPAAPQREVQHVSLFPSVFHAVEQRVSAAFDDVNDLSALKLDASRAAPRRYLLLEAQIRREDGVGDLGMHVPAHDSLSIDLDG